MIDFPHICESGSKRVASDCRFDCPDDEIDRCVFPAMRWSPRQGARQAPRESRRLIAPLERPPRQSETIRGSNCLSIGSPCRLMLGPLRIGVHIAPKRSTTGTPESKEAAVRPSRAPAQSRREVPIIHLPFHRIPSTFDAWSPSLILMPSCAKQGVASFACYGICLPPSGS
jgi:hypothetical protein